MTDTYTFYVQVETFPEMGFEIELEAKFNYYPESGDNWNEPRTDAEIEICNISPKDPSDIIAAAIAHRYNNDVSIDLSHLQDAILQDLPSDSRDDYDYEDAMDRRSYYYEEA